MANETLISISQVAEATGLPSSALRYYEKSGLIESAGRAGGRRQFSQNVLKRLGFISLLQEVGFTISEIAELIQRSERRDHWRSLAEKKLEEIDKHIERVTAARNLLEAALDCGCKRLDECGMVTDRSGRHRRVVQTLSLRFGPPPSSTTTD